MDPYTDDRASVTSHTLPVNRLANILSKIKGFFRKVDQDKSNMIDATVFVEMLRLHNIEPVVQSLAVTSAGQVNYVKELARVVAAAQTDYKMNDLVSVLDWDGISMAGSRLSRDAKSQLDLKSTCKSTVSKIEIRKGDLKAKDTQSNTAQKKAQMNRYNSKVEGRTVDGRKGVISPPERSLSKVTVKKGPVNYSTNNEQNIGQLLTKQHKSALDRIELTHSRMRDGYTTVGPNSNQTSNTNSLVKLKENRLI